MKFKLLPVLILAFAAHRPSLVSSIGTDMGDCACLCGLETNGGVVGEDGTSSTISSFASRVRGEKGDRGLTGKQGMQGQRGRPGVRGARGPPGASSGGKNNNNALQSCFDTHSAGQKQSGLYKIKPNPMSSTFQVYCDQETSGGGWTLVASIHENNIKGKCTLGDNWSDDQGNINHTSSSAWMNTKTFGNVESATSDDYKNAAYFNLPASDVMIWHVPNDVPPSQWSNQAFLKYFTTNRFLSSYGGNLRNLFLKFYPMERVPASTSVFEGVKTILSSMATSASPEVITSIQNFYTYIYDGPAPNLAIADGGSDMFDDGNQVQYNYDGRDWVRLTYGESTNNIQAQFEISSVAGTPFIALMNIGNRAGTHQSYGFRVVSGTGADGEGNFLTSTRQISYQGFQMAYKYYHVYGTQDPSIVELFFAVWNHDQWKSVLNFESFTSPDWGSGTDNMIHSVVLNGSPQNVLLGYLLLSKTNGGLYSEDEVQNVMMLYLKTISIYPTISTLNCSRLEESLVVPIEYHTGNAGQILAGVPPAVSDETYESFLQFRALDPKGFPYAMCPGVRTESCTPSSVCIGSINTFPDNMHNCGDYTGYAGLEGDSPTEEDPSGYARNLKDLKSSILIFTRDTDNSGAPRPAPSTPVAKKPLKKSGGK